MAYVIYIKLSESVLAENRKVTIKDVSKVICENPDIKYEVEKIELMTFSHVKQGQQVISSLDIIEEIQKRCKDCQIVNLGVPEVIVYYKTYDPSDRVKQILKFILVCLIAFLGAGFSIVSYNSDVNLVGQLDLLQNLFVGESEAGSTIAGIAYSVGLLIGIIVFFNHGANKKFTDDPTPLQVQMRKKDVRDAD